MPTETKKKKIELISNEERFYHFTSLEPKEIMRYLKFKEEILKFAWSLLFHRSEYLSIKEQGIKILDTMAKLMERREKIILKNIFELIHDNYSIFQEKSDEIKNDFDLLKELCKKRSEQILKTLEELEAKKSEVTKIIKLISQELNPQEGLNEDLKLDQFSKRTQTKIKTRLYST